LAADDSTDDRAGETFGGVRELARESKHGDWLMATATRRKTASWKRPGSPIGRRGPRKANPKYKRNSREPWGRGDVQTLKQLARQNMPTRVIGLKLGRTETAVRGKAQREGISLRPVNRSPNKERRRG
jgi:hypothetical protein